MKKTTWIMAGLIAVFPLAGVADITINAYAQDGAIAYLYNGSGTFGTTTFSGGQAIIPTAGISNGDSWSIAMQYKPGAAYYSQLAWGMNGSAPVFPTTSFTGEAVTGEITDRSLAGTTASVRLSANGNLGNYQSLPYDVGADIGLYRTVKTSLEVTDNNLTKITRTWDSSTLIAGYGLTTSVFDAALGLTTLTITNEAGTFNADYVGTDIGGGEYDLLFLNLDTKDAATYGSRTSVGDDLVFEVNGLGDGIYEDATAYYVLMDAAYMEDGDGNYSEAYDAGMALLAPDYYVIPEPAVMVMLLGGGGVLLATRRIFMI